jgi:hypothetical protein
MTSFLRANGIIIPVDPGSAEIGQKDVGSEHDAIDGTPIVNRRARKRNWKLTTVVGSAASSLAYRDLLTGEGQALSFDNQSLYTSKGLAPSSIGANWSTTTSGPKFGAACAAWTNTNTAWPFFSTLSPWTVAYWLNKGGTGYHHVVVTSAGTSWLDGALGGSLPAGWGSLLEGFGGVSSGVATFGSASASKIDDIVALPYVVPSSWPAQMYAWGATAGLPFSSLERVTIDGLFIELNTLVTVVGKCTGGKVVKAASAADLHKMSFELREV